MWVSPELRVNGGRRRKHNSLGKSWKFLIQTLPLILNYFFIKLLKLCFQGNIAWQWPWVTKTSFSLNFLRNDPLSLFNCYLESIFPSNFWLWIVNFPESQVPGKLTLGNFNCKNDQPVGDVWRGAIFDMGKLGWFRIYGIRIWKFCGWSHSRFAISEFYFTWHVMTALFMLT